MRIPLSQAGLADQVRLAPSARRLRKPAFLVIDGLQKAEVLPGEQVLACAVTLRAMCESANVPIDEVLRKAAAMMADVEGPFTSHLQAVRDYATNELRRHRR